MRLWILFGLLVFGLAALVLWIPPAKAQETTAGGWTFSEGFWWKDGVAYNRSRVYYPQQYTYSYGCRIALPRSYYYEYSRATSFAKKTIAYTPNWKDQIIKAAAARDDHRAYLEALAALGLSAPFKDRGAFGNANYGSRAYGSSYGSSYAQPAQGSTFYGRSVNEVRETYGDTNLNTLYQQLSRTVSKAQDLGGDAARLHAELIDKAGTRTAAVAEILARARAAELVLRNLNAAPSTKTTTTTTETGSSETRAPARMRGAENGNGGDETPRPARALTDEHRVFLKEVGIPECGACHSGKSPKGGFNIAEYPLMDLESRKNVWALILTDDAKVRMPKDKPPLSQTKFARFVTLK